MYSKKGPVIGRTEVCLQCRCSKSAREASTGLEQECAAGRSQFQVLLGQNFNLLLEVADEQLFALTALVRCLAITLQANLLLALFVA